MRCSDENFYVVKFINNPQHPRILANEMIATRLAEAIGLPVPATDLVEVGDWLIAHTPELSIQFAHNTVRCEAGLQFGSRYVVDPGTGPVWDYLPAEHLSRVRNLETFAGILAFDKWTGNADGRQVVFWKRAKDRKYLATFIDQGYCFNAGEWSFPDYPLRGVYARNEVYEDISGWHSFEPWISTIEELRDETIWEIVNAVPCKWYEGKIEELERLTANLLLRKHQVRKFIDDFRESPRRPFPNWFH